MKIFLKLLPLLNVIIFLSFILFCNTNIDQNKQNSKTEKNFNDRTSSRFNSFSNASKSFYNNGKYFTHYHLKNDWSNISFYLSRYQDTFILVKKQDTNFKNPMHLVFLPLSSKQDDTFSYTDYIQFSEDEALPGETGIFKLLSKNIIADDTIYTFSHTCYPNELIEANRDYPIIIPRIIRTFKFSLKKGFLYYNETNIKGYKNVKFYW